MIRDNFYIFRTGSAIHYVINTRGYIRELRGFSRRCCQSCVKSVIWVASKSAAKESVLKVEIENEKEISRSVNHKFCMDAICTVGCAACQIYLLDFLSVKHKTNVESFLRWNSRWPVYICIVLWLISCIVKHMNGSFCAWDYICLGCFRCLSCAWKWPYNLRL